MSLIKCPECGHTVLSVASTCPNCDHRLSPDPIPRSGLSDLVECPRCRKLLTKTTVLCPHCGFRARRFRLIVRSIAAVVVLAALSVAGYFAFRPPAPSGIPLADPAPLQPTPEPSRPVAAPLEDTAPAMPPESLTTEPAERPAAPVRPATPPRSDIRPVATRYTTTWVNVREARSTDARVMQILNPGTAVQVGGFRNGWWGVFVAGELLGYVAADLLASVPTDTAGG